MAASPTFIDNKREENILIKEQGKQFSERKRKSFDITPITKALPVKNKFLKTHSKLRILGKISANTYENELLEKRE